MCSLVVQRVVGMTHVARGDQQNVHRYALDLLRLSQQEEGEGEEMDQAECDA